MRLDLFLKTSRLVKRRTVARELCEAGRVLVNGLDAKPSKEVRPGDRVSVRYSAKRVELEVLDISAASGRPSPQECCRLISETRIARPDSEW